MRFENKNASLVLYECPELGGRKDIKQYQEAVK
jgi:hypothetical protein